MLLKLGKINVNSRNKYGRTLLLWAIREGHKAIINILLDEGADLEFQDQNGRMPLSWETGKGYEAVVNMLLEKGANLESQDRNGWTPLL